MKTINLDQWNRKQQYLFFKDYDMPRYMVTVTLDITTFYQIIKDQNLSFYLSFMHLVMVELNKIENFNYRIIDDIPYDIEQSHPSFTDVIEHSELFKIVNADFHPDLKTFICNAKEKSKSQNNNFINLEEELRHDLVYISTFPWASYTQISNAYQFEKHDATPRIVWGKFERIEEKLMMPFTIEVHHALVDGFHVGQLIQSIQYQLHHYK